MLGVEYGRDAVILPYSDFVRYYRALQDMALEYAKTLIRKRKKPTYKELRKYVYGILTEDMKKLKARGIKEIVVFFPHEGENYKKRTVVFLRDPESFFHILEVESGLSSWYAKQVEPLIEARRKLKI